MNGRPIAGDLFPKEGQKQEIAGTILIVDDTPNNLRLLSMMLTEQGYKVRAILNGPMAIKSVQLERPDIILLDICMPEMDGYAVCEQLKSNSQTQDIPIIFISALDESIDKVKAFTVGGMDYITKPFHPEEVLLRIQNQLTVRYLQKQLEQQIEELQTLNMQLQNELQLARNIQQKFLPPTRPKWDDLDVYCYSKPAHEVGGDLYLYHRFPVHRNTGVNRHVVAVGDVSGMGMPAALLMSASVASFRSLVESNLPPAAFLEQMNGAIADYTNATGLNCAFVYVDMEQIPPSDTAQPGDNQHRQWNTRLINAGGVYPLLRRSNGEVSWVQVQGVPLGARLIPHPGYRELTLTLETGDMLVLMTDGVIEAKHASGELFGFERVEQVIRDGPKKGASAMLSHFQEAIASFLDGQEPHDDITMVVVHV